MQLVLLLAAASSNASADTGQQPLASQPLQTQAPAQSLQQQLDALPVLKSTPDAKFLRTRNSAKAGNIIAQYELFIMYSEGTLVPRDDSKAMVWLQRSGTHGYLKAQETLWSIYHNGDGVPKDEARAMMWLQKAAAQGGAIEQYELGSAYWYGDIQFRDLVLAYAWLKLAEARDGNYSKTINELEALLSPAQRDEGRRLASGWKHGDILETTRNKPRKE